MRQVAIGSVNLDAIEPSSLRVTGCGSIVIDRTNNFLFCHLSRKRRLNLNGVPAVVYCVDLDKIASVRHRWGHGRVAVLQAFMAHPSCVP